CLCDRADRESSASHAARRVVPGSRVAPDGLASAAEGRADQVGICPSMSARAVFLDRDGTLNRAFMRDNIAVPPATPADFELLPGVPEAVARLHDAGLRLVVVTKQPDVARGTQDRATVEQMHDLLRA